jgi:hypothetical protein
MDGRNAGNAPALPARPWTAGIPEMQEHFPARPWASGVRQINDQDNEIVETVMVQP